MLDIHTLLSFLRLTARGRTELSTAFRIEFNDEPSGGGQECKLDQTQAKGAAR
jgi:hypothetical protein